MHPCVANEMRVIATCVVDKYVSVRAEVGLFREENANCILERNAVDEMFEEKFGKEAPTSMRDEIFSTKADDVVEVVSKEN